MATPFQHRLVGTLVLVSLGVIILPDVFDGEKAHYQEDFQAIPLQEQVNEHVMAEAVKPPEEPEIFEPVRAPVSVTIDEGKAIVKKPAAPASKPSNTQPDYATEDSAWVIRLGTFRNVENAKKLVEDLRKKGYSAQISPRNVKEGELARVEVGPDISKEKLAAMTADLESLTGLKGQVLRFNPLSS